MRTSGMKGHETLIDEELLPELKNGINGCSSLQ